MGSLSDIRPLLYTARLFGCGLFLVKEDDIVIMKYGAIYSALFAILYAGLCIANFYMLRWDDVIGPRLLTLTVVRTCLTYACVLSDIAMTFWYNWKIRAALSQLRIFDRATKYKESGHRIRYICWALAFAILLFWSIVGYITFCVELKDSVFNGVTYAIVNATLSMQLMTFASLSSLLYERFRRLCELLLLPEGRLIAKNDGKIMIADRSGKQFHLQEVWWLHSCLTNATEMINSVYALQLLLWIASMSFNTLTRIYTLNDNDAILQPLLMVREILLVSGCVTNLLIITIICHVTAAQANRVGKIVFTPSSAILAKRNFTQILKMLKLIIAINITICLSGRIEKDILTDSERFQVLQILTEDCSMEAVTYFQLRQVHFFAFYEIIRIDLPLLLSIASNITTYLVILHTANV